MTQPMYDIITVGGGLAGAALATRMASAGARVLVLEREQRFRDRVRGEWLTPWGVEEVKRLGLLGVLDEAGAHPLPFVLNRSLKPRRIANAQGEVPLTFSHPAAQEALLTAAARAGAEVIPRPARAVGGGRRDPAGGLRRRAEQPRGQRPLGGGRRRPAPRWCVARRASPCARMSPPSLIAGVLLGNIDAAQDTAYYVIRDDARALGSIYPQGNGRARAYVVAQDADTQTFSGPDGFQRFLELMITSGVPDGDRAAIDARGTAGGVPGGHLVRRGAFLEQPGSDRRRRRCQ